ncbi:MAG: AAA family ATPase [Deltaproteobacteria bacterium]|jgi:hypothetical protein|nr:AAA family ATPase [Deltaproteobacteria bacterium]
MTETMTDLPIGIASFKRIRSKNYIYADKTELLYKLLKRRNPLLFSRPRRFGKTLLISTLEAILRGRRELFKGLWLDKSDYDWAPKPVIRLSLASIDTESVSTVKSDLIFKVKAIAKSEGLFIRGETPGRLFSSLLKRLYDKYHCDVAVLIDEYDAPILNKIEKPELAEEIRDTLKKFYLVLKDEERIRGFTLITGITLVGGVVKNANSFNSPGLNNLYDLTLKPEYSTICGFTIEEFDSLFSKHMEAMLVQFKADGIMPKEATLTDIRQLILNYYDGYSWDGQTSVLNPWSILNAFKVKMLGNYWWQTGGVPSFLKQLVHSGDISFSHSNSEVSITNSCNVLELGDQLEPTPVLFQSGYLTVERVKKNISSAYYFLKIPNIEVRVFLIHIVLSLEQIINPLRAMKQAEAMLNSLINLESKGFEDSFMAFIGCFYPNDSAKNKEEKGYFQRLLQAAVLLVCANIEIELEAADEQHGGKNEQYDGNFDPYNDRKFILKYREAGQDAYRLATLVIEGQMPFSQQRQVYVEFKKEQQIKKAKRRANKRQIGP